MRGAIKVSKEGLQLSVLHRAEIVKNLLVVVAPESEIVGLEIGVWRGDMLRHLMTQIPSIKMLYGIDPWMPTPKYGRKRPIVSWDAVYKETQYHLSGYPQVRLIRGMSVDVIDQVPNNLHFIEIDGDHTYSHVREDLEMSEPKIIPGGLLCGHDYYGGYSPDVRRAVDEFAAIKGKEVQSRCEDVGMWWWYK